MRVFLVFVVLLSLFLACLSSPVKDEARTVKMDELREKRTVLRIVDYRLPGDYVSDKLIRGDGIGAPSTPLTFLLVNPFMPS